MTKVWSQGTNGMCPGQIYIYIYLSLSLSLLSVFLSFCLSVCLSLFRALGECVSGAYEAGEKCLSCGAAGALSILVDRCSRDGLGDCGHHCHQSRIQCCGIVACMLHDNLPSFSTPRNKQEFGWWGRGQTVAEQTFHQSCLEKDVGLLWWQLECQ